jgi:hypothetical protein
MSGIDERRDGRFSYVRPGSQIPKNRPLLVIRMLADEALATLNAQLAEPHAENGPPRCHPNRCCSRCCRRPSTRSSWSGSSWMEQINCNLLFRRFVGLSVDGPVWVQMVLKRDPGIFTKPGHQGSRTGNGAPSD